MEYYDIDSDSSNYVESEDNEEEIMIDENLIEMSDTKKEDAKYLSIFENSSYYFDEQIMGLEDVEALKNGSCHD